MEQHQCDRAGARGQLESGHPVDAVQREQNDLSEPHRHPARRYDTFQCRHRGIRERGDTDSRHRAPDFDAPAFSPVDALVLLLPGGHPHVLAGERKSLFRAQWQHALGFPNGLVLGPAESFCDLVPPGSTQPYHAAIGWRDGGRSRRQLFLAAGTPDLAHGLGASLSAPPFRAHHGGLDHLCDRDRSHLLL